MKQKKIISMIGALVLIIGAVVFVTGCPQPNAGNNKSDTDNVQGILGVTSTGNAVDSVKGIKWEPDLQNLLPGVPMVKGETPALVFAQKGNVVSIKVSSLEIAVATYKVEDKTVIFDLSGVFDVCKNMTVDNLIEMGKKVLPIAIKELESAIGKEKNAEIKAEMEKALKTMKENLEELKKATQELKEELKSVVEQIKKEAKELEIYKQIKGILNTDNSELSFDISGVGKVILKKQK